MTRVVDFNLLKTKAKNAVIPVLRGKVTAVGELIIEAELWGEPVPIQLYLRTLVDLDTGEVDIVESTGTD